MYFIYLDVFSLNLYQLIDQISIIFKKDYNFEKGTFVWMKKQHILHLTIQERPEWWAL